MVLSLGSGNIGNDYTKISVCKWNIYSLLFISAIMSNLMTPLRLVRIDQNQDIRRATYTML